MERIKLPIPVVILALTGALTLFSALAGRAPAGWRAPVRRLTDQRIQAAERQPAALTYFQIMDWLVRFLPSDPGKAGAASAGAPSAASMNTPGRGRGTPAQLCALHDQANSSMNGRGSTPSARPFLGSASAEN